MDIDARVQRLIMVNRILTVLVLICCMVTGWMFIESHVIGNNVVCNSITVNDLTGKPRIQISAVNVDEPAIKIFDQENRKKINISNDSDGPVMAMYGDDGNFRIRHYVYDNEPYSQYVAGNHGNDVMIDKNSINIRANGNNLSFLSLSFNGIELRDNQFNSIFTTQRE